MDGQNRKKYISAGIDPKYVLIAPILGIPKLLKKAGLTVDDIDIFEINEAFSSSSVAITKTLGLDPDKVNPEAAQWPWATRSVQPGQGSW